MSHGSAITVEIAARREQINALQQENRLLRQKIDALIRRYFGKSSEAIDPGQLELLLAGLLGQTPPPRPEPTHAAPTPPTPIGLTTVPCPLATANWLPSLPLAAGYT